jgi:hypothetical protein
LAYLGYFLSVQEYKDEVFDVEKSHLFKVVHDGANMHFVAPDEHYAIVDETFG